MSCSGDTTKPPRTLRRELIANAQRLMRRDRGIYWRDEA